MDKSCLRCRVDVPRGQKFCEGCEADMHFNLEDPTGYYERKMKRAEEVLPYLGWMFVAMLVMMAFCALKGGC